MSFTRDLGIQFPSDATQAGPSTPLLARSVYRYVTRGSRYGGQLGKLSGFEYPLGITFFRHLMPKSTIGVPVPVEYAKFLDLRKTKIVDSIKEIVFGTEFRAGLDTELDINKIQGFDQGHTHERRNFFAKISGTLFLTQGGVFLVGWHEVVWDKFGEEWVQKPNGYSSIQGQTNSYAFHAPSSGQHEHLGEDIVQMSLVETADGFVRATFVTESEGVFLSVITQVQDLGSINPTYWAQAEPEEQYPNINVSNVAPWNRLVQPVKYNRANVGDKCLIFTSKNQGYIGLWVFTETIDTIDCPAPNAFQAPLDDPTARLNDVVYVNTNPNAVGAIGQAL